MDNCTALESNCAKGDRNGTCIRCFYGYQLNDVGSCFELPTGCVNGDINGTCNRCAGRWFFNSFGDCEKLSQGCVIGNSTGCKTCISGYYLTSNRQCQWLPPDCN